MFKTIITIAIALSAQQVFAKNKPNDCSNYAKYAAIKAYKAEVGTVQGSQGIEYTSKLLSQNQEAYSHLVSITDGNEDGEVWTFNYEVHTTKAGDKCIVNYLEKLSIE